MDGGYAQYVTLRTEAVVPIPQDMDPVEVAPLLCAGVTTFSKSTSFPPHEMQFKMLIHAIQILSVTWTFILATLLRSRESEDLVILLSSSQTQWVSALLPFLPLLPKRTWLTS